MAAPPIDAPPPLPLQQLIDRFRAELAANGNDPGVIPLVCEDLLTAWMCWEAARGMGPKNHAAQRADFDRTRARIEEHMQSVVARAARALGMPLTAAEAATKAPDRFALTMQPTADVGVFQGLPVRVWRGRTPRGTAVVAFIALIQSLADDDCSELDRELTDMTAQVEAELAAAAAEARAELAMLDMLNRDDKPKA